MVIEKRIDKRLPKISLVVFHTQWHLKGKLRSIYLESFMNHRLSFQSNQRGFRIRCKHPQRGHQYQADWWPVFHEQDFEVSAIESQRARISSDVQLRTTIYVYIYATQKWEAFVDLPTFIQYLFHLELQTAGTYSRNDVNAQSEFSKCCSLLFDYLFTFNAMFNLLFVDHYVDFYKNTSSPKDIKNERCETIDYL